MKMIFIDSLASLGVIGVVFSVIIALILLSKTLSIKGQHVMITGGSSGIGKCIGIEMAHRGANITLLARDEKKLQDAKEQIGAHFMNPKEQKIEYQCVDISGNYDKIEQAVKKAENSLGPVDILVNCAGFSIPSQLEDLSSEDIKKLLEVNCLGGIYVTRCVLPSMKKQHRGHIMFTSSIAGLFGIFGFTAYSASKFALRGFAESLQMEVKPYNIKITVAFPPDTDTPGFAEEEKIKPLETKLISNAGGLSSPESVARSMVIDMLNGKFFSTTSFDGKIVAIACAGLSPISSVFDFVLQVLFMGPIRIIGVGLIAYFNYLVKKCKVTKEQEKKSKVTKEPEKKNK